MTQELRTARDRLVQYLQDSFEVDHFRASNAADDIIAILDRDSQRAETASSPPK